MFTPAVEGFDEVILEEGLNAYAIGMRLPKVYSWFSLADFVCGGDPSSSVVKAIVLYCRSV
jgi:hypothetical protein